MITHCLIFVPFNKRRQRVARVTQSSSEEPEIRGYVLIQELFVSKCPEVIEFFSNCDMQIISSNQDNTDFQTALKNQRFGIFEVQLERDNNFPELPPAQFRTHSHNVSLPFLIRVHKIEDTGFAKLLLRVNENDVFTYSYYLKGYFNATAINERNLEVLKNVLPHGVDIDNLHSQGGTLLHFAVDAGEVALVNLLLEKECCVNAQQPNGVTALHIAAKNSNLEIVESLLQHGADVNARATFESFKDCTPPVLAVRYGQLAVFKALLNGAPDVNVNFDSDLGCSLLELAVRQKQHFDFVKSILECQPDVNDKRHKEVFLNILCYEKRNFPPVKHDTLPSPTFQEEVPLAETVQIMLQYGFSIDTKHVENLSDLLFAAVHKNCIEIVRELLEMEMDVNEPRVLSFAIKTGYQHKYTPLHIAAVVGDEDMIRLLINRGADVNIKYTYLGYHSEVCIGESATVMALRADRLNIAKFLLLNGANVQDDPSAMYTAALRGNLEMIKMVLEHGAPLNSGRPWNSPIYVAACEGSIKLLEFLFNYGAQLSSEYDTSYPSLFTYTSEKPEMLQFLLDQSFTNTQIITGSRIFQFFKLTKPAIDDRLIADPAGKDFANKFDRSANILARHIIKLESANLFVCDENAEKIWYSEENIYDFWSACEAEITKMKQDKVCGNFYDYNENETTVTFYDILTQNLEQLAGYAKNETIVKAMETEFYKDRFPIFAGAIKYQFQKGHYRTKLVNQGIKVMYELFKNIQAVASRKINMEIILDYLSNRDLLCLNDVFSVHT